MRVIYKDKFQTIEKEYPNKDISKPVEGLNEIKVNGQKQPVKTEDRIDYYFINEVIPVNENPEQYNLLQLEDVLTDEFHMEYKHLKICNRMWILVEKSQAEVKQRLNDELGIFLDEQYPFWERDKHMRKELFGKSTTDEKKYIKELDAWMDKCRALRDTKEAAYLSGTFPDLKTWITKPTEVTNLKIK
jgi:hypothetical protein